MSAELLVKSPHQETPGTFSRLLSSTYVRVSFLGLILIAGSVFGNNTLTYNQFQQVPLVVVGKIASGNGHLEMVLRTDDGFEFDRLVSATTYLRFKAGDRVTFKLRPMDIRPSMRDGAVFYIFVGFPFVLGISLTISALLMAAINSAVRGSIPDGDG